MLRLVELSPVDRTAHVRASRGADLEAYETSAAAELGASLKHERARVAAIEKDQTDNAIVAWREADAHLQLYLWPPTASAIETAVKKKASSKTKAVEKLEGQVKRVRLAGWVPALKKADAELDMTQGQGGGGVEPRLESLKKTCKRVLVLSRQLKLVPLEKPPISLAMS